MQKILIQYLLDPLCRFTGRFSQKTRDRMFILGGMVIVLLGFLRHAELVGYRYLYHYVGCCAGMGLMILGSLGQAVRPVRFRKVFSLIWFGYAGIQLLSGIFNSSNYLPEAMLLLVAYPILFICWNNADFTRIWHLLCRILQRSLLVFAIGSWFLSPITLSKYPGMFTNTNNAAYFLCLSAIASLLELIYGTVRSREGIRNIAYLALALALNYYTNSRTGTLALILSLGFALVLYRKGHSATEFKHCLTRLAAGGLAALIAVGGLVYVYQLRQFVPLPYYDPDELGAYFPGDNPEYQEMFGKFFGLDGFTAISDQKNNVMGKDLDAYSTGRVSIWLAYAQDLNWTGHSGVPPKYIPGYNKEFESTHMTCLQIAYESGIPAGLIFLTMNLLTGGLTIYYAWKHDRQRYALAPLMFTVTFGVLSMLGSCVASFGYLTTFLYYLSQYPTMACLPEAEA